MIKKFFWLSIFMLAFCAAPSSAQTPKLEDLRVSFASFGVIYYPHFIARELGFYRDEGLNVDWIAMPGGLATQALVAGDLHFSTSSGASLTASLRGIRLKVVYVNLDRPLYRLITWRDDVHKVTDLRGKGIGVASRGDTMEGSANLLLRKYGMDPARDVVWVALGTGGRVSSLIAKTVDSAVLGFADSTMEMMTADGTEDLETQKSDIDIGRRFLNVQKEIPTEQVFDFRYTREVYKELRELGWDKVLKTGK